MESFNPKVSIIIPVYNGADYMRDAIDSALGQTYRNIEVLVINDGSNDDGETERIAKSYGNKIRYYAKSNGGVATALNLGIEKMEGEYFSWLSHDDKYKPQKVELQIRELANRKDKTTILYGGYQNFSDTNGVFETIDFRKKYTAKELETHVFPVFHLALNGCTLLIHKSHFARVGMFDVTLPTTQDYDLWFRMFRNQKPYCMEGCQVLSRSHPNQGSKALIDIHTVECENLWKKCLAALTDKEMCELSGSRYTFFSETYDFFTRNLYYPTINSLLRASAIQELHKMNLPMDKLFAEVYSQIGASIPEKDTKALRQKSTKKRIAYFLGTPNELGGLNRIVLQTAAILAAEYDVWLIDTEKYNGSGYSLDERIHEVTLEWHIFKIVDMLSLLNIEVLIGSYNCLDFSFQLYKAVQDAGIKVIAWNHEHYFSPYHYGLSDELGYRAASLGTTSAVVWLTNYSGAIYSLHHDNGIVIPNTLSLPSKAQKADSTPPQNIEKKADEKIIIAVSRFTDEQKGFDKLLRAFAKIYRKDNRARLLLVGKLDLEATCCTKICYLTGNKYKQYKEILKECRLPAGVVRAAGQVKDVRPYYEVADLHLMTSSYEGFGLAITEAASYAIPTVAFSGNGYEDIIDNDKTGYIVRDVDEMVEKSLKILTDEDCRKKMSAAAKCSVDKFAAEKVSAAWIELINHVLIDDKAQLNIFLQKKRESMPKLTNEQLIDIIKEYELDVAMRQNGKTVSVPGYDNGARDELERMKQTISWKITKPLRMVRNIMKKEKDE